MRSEAIFSADGAVVPGARRLEGLWSAVVRLALRVAVLVLLLAAWQVGLDAPYTPGSDFGYALGVSGGCLMLALLLYPLRKRIRRLSVAGPVRHWFRFHMVAGVLAPTMILFHSTFRVGSFNAAIALTSMLLVMASGLVGRFLYRHIHHGLFGSRATLDELRQDMERQIAAAQPVLARLPAVGTEAREFFALAAHEPKSLSEAVARLLSLGWRRHTTMRRVRRAIAACAGAGNADPAMRATLGSLTQTISNMLGAAQRTAQFSTHERLFSLWHMVHVPFLWMLLITAIVHVVAVHAY